MTRTALITSAVLVAVLLAFAGPAQARPAHRASLDRVERSVIREVNAVRADRGLRALKHRPALSRAADRHSRDMASAGFFDHTSSDGTRFDRRIRSFARSASTVGEVLAAVPLRGGVAAEVVRMWLESPPHRAIILSDELGRIGVARRWGEWNGVGHSFVTADFSD